MSDEQEFLDYLIDPVGSRIIKAVDEFHYRWDDNIDVLNLMETEGRGEQPRHWVAHIYTIDQLLVRNFTDSIIHYITKHHPPAIINPGFYNDDSNVWAVGILEYEKRGP